MICRHALLRRDIAEHVLLLLIFSPHRSSCRTLTCFSASSGDQRGAFFNKLLESENITPMSPLSKQVRIKARGRSFGQSWLVSWNVRSAPLSFVITNSTQEPC